jgi:hypothetical protein
MVPMGEGNEIKMEKEKVYNLPRFFSKLCNRGNGKDAVISILNRKYFF